MGDFPGTDRERSFLFCRYRDTTQLFPYIFRNYLLLPPVFFVPLGRDFSISQRLCSSQCNRFPTRVLSGKQYLRCTKRLDNKSCPGCGKIITSELEAVVYQQMVKKLEKHKTLTGRKKAAKANPKIAALQVELLHVDSEIEKLVDSLTGANNVLLSYVNVKIAELDGRKQELVKQIAELTVETISPGQVNQISGYLDTWDNVSFDDKRRVVDLMITTVAATSDSLNITWKI